MNQPDAVNFYDLVDQIIEDEYIDSSDSDLDFGDVDVEIDDDDYDSDETELPDFTTEIPRRFFSVPTLSECRPEMTLELQPFRDVVFPQEDENRLKRILLRIRERDWILDVTQLKDMGLSRFTLVHVGTTILQSYDALRTILPRTESLEAFLTSVSAQYHDIPYHNLEHAADVLHSVHCLLQGLKLEPWELYSALLAAILIDVGHMGISKRQSHPTINGADLIENLQCGMLDRLPIVLRGSVKNLVRKLTLATTDVALSPSSNVLKVILCAADVSSSTKTQSIHSFWEKALSDELIQHGHSPAAVFNVPGHQGCPRRSSLSYSRAYYLQNKVLPLYQTLETNYGINVKQPLLFLDSNIVQSQNQL